MRVKHLNFLTHGQQECQPFLNTVMSTSLRTLEVFGMQANVLLQQLDETFPPTNPNPEDTMEKIMYRSGQRSVVEWIKENLEN